MIIPVIAGSHQEFLYWRKGQPVDDYRYIPVNSPDMLKGYAFNEIKYIGTYYDRWSYEALQQLETIVIPRIGRTKK
jgi:hypothetical protein